MFSSSARVYLIFEFWVCLLSFVMDWCILLYLSASELGPDYKSTYIYISETYPLKIKLAITWRRIQPGLKIVANFSPLKSPKKSHVMETKGAFLWGDPDPDQ